MVESELIALCPRVTLCFSVNSVFECFKVCFCHCNVAHSFFTQVSFRFEEIFSFIYNKTSIILTTQKCFICQNTLVEVDVGRNSEYLVF